MDKTNVFTAKISNGDKEGYCHSKSNILVSENFCALKNERFSKFNKMPNLELQKAEKFKNKIVSNENSSISESDLNLLNSRIDIAIDVLNQKKENGQPKDVFSLLPSNGIKNIIKKPLNRTKYSAHCGISFVPSPSRIVSNPFQPKKIHENSKGYSSIMNKTSNSKTGIQSTNDNIKTTEKEKLKSTTIASPQPASNNYTVIQKYSVKNNTAHAGLVFKRKEQKGKLINPFV